MILEYEGIKPVIGRNVFMAPGSHVIGKVEIGDDSSLWFNCVLRGDDAKITVGCGTNIQDGAVLHGNRLPEITEVVVGDNVTVGHNAILHGCTVGDGCIIGMGAVILNRAVVGKGCLIGAGTVVKEDTVIPDGVMVVGNPARVIREVSGEQAELLGISAMLYIEEGVKYERMLQASAITGTDHE